jgi:hypothetical protein
MAGWAPRLTPANAGSGKLLLDICEPAWLKKQNANGALRRLHGEPTGE